MYENYDLAGYLSDTNKPPIPWKTLFQSDYFQLYEDFEEYIPWSIK